MTAYPEPTPPLHVEIKTGPHGHRTELLIDGVKAKGAREFVLSAASDALATLTVTYVNVQAVVDGYVETTEFNAEHKTYLAPLEAVEDEDPEGE